MKVCRQCGTPLEGKQRNWCTGACKQRAYRAKRHPQPDTVTNGAQIDTPVTIDRYGLDTNVQVELSVYAVRVLLQHCQHLTSTSKNLAVKQGGTWNGTYYKRELEVYSQAVDNLTTALIRIGVPSL